MYKQNIIRFAKLSTVMVISLSAAMLNAAIMAPIQEAQANALPQASANNESASSTIETDFTLPVTTASVSNFFDGKKRTFVFTDNVVIRQGSLEILADRVEANASAGKGKEIIMANGTPASYKQRLADGTMITASANEIVYEVASRTISLRGNAAINQNEIKVNGDSIAFDMAKEQIIASTDADSSEIVTTVLSPGAFANPEIKDDDNQ